MTFLRKRWFSQCVHCSLLEKGLIFVHVSPAAEKALSNSMIAVKFSVPPESLLGISFPLYSPSMLVFLCFRSQLSHLAFYIFLSDLVRSRDLSQLQWIGSTSLSPVLILIIYPTACWVSLHGDS